MIKGIDVSNWQGNIDFGAVKASGVEIVYMKSSQGEHTKDAFFEANYAGAKSAGLKVGFYHFLEGNEAGATQAEWMYENIKGKDFDCKIAIDAEQTNGATGSELSKIICDFGDRITALTGKEVVLYTYSNFIKETLDMNMLSKYPLWVAEYGVDNPQITQPYIGWQYSDAGQVAGCPNGHTDLDWFTEDIYLVGNRGLGVSTQENFSVGNMVRIIGTHYATGQEIPAWVKSNEYPIIQVKDEKCLLGSGLLSWVNKCDLEKAFVVGDKVKVIGSRYATGEAIPAWVKTETFTILQVTNDKVLLKEIMSWVYQKDITLVG